MFKKWEDECYCGEGNVKKGLVQIFKETNVQLSTFKLKIPLCMGSLISHHHILTTKYCFGSDKYEEIHGSDYAYEEILKWDQKGRDIHEIE